MQKLLISRIDASIYKFKDRSNICIWKFKRWEASFDPIYRFGGEPLGSVTFNRINQTIEPKVGASRALIRGVEFRPPWIPKWTSNITRMQKPLIVCVQPASEFVQNPALKAQRVR